MGEETDTRIASALDLAARGYRVFPLKVGDYRPAIKDWQKLATTNPDQIKRAWARGDWNIGVACGHGLLVVDVDMKKGKDGLASLKALGVEPEGFVVRTPTGGLHVYYDGPDVANSVGRLGLGLDVRSAGGYVVGPGSALLEGIKDGQLGGLYERHGTGSSGDVPASIIHRLAVPVERGAGLGSSPDDDAAIERGVEFLSGRAALADEGNAGDHTTFTVAARLKDFGVSEETAYELLLEYWNDRCSPPWEPEDLRTKVANAYEYGTSPAGSAHPFADFGNVKHIPAPTETRAVSSWFRHGDARGKVNWLYRNVLPTIGVAVLLAPSQAGKTFLAIEIARSLATGKSFFKEEPRELGGTLFVFAGTEGSGLALRLDALAEPERLPISATTVGNLAEPKALQRLLESLQAEAAYILETFNVPVRLIVIETMAASGLLVDENDNSEASRAMGNLAQISHAMGALVLTSHHPSKDGKGSRGASAIPNSADYVIEIIRHERATVREVELTKARDAEQRRLGSFTLLKTVLGQDDDGEDVTSMTVSMGEARIDLGKTPPFFDNFLQSIEYGAGEDGEIINGQKAVSADAARLIFRDLKTGSKDRSNYGKAFSKCQAYAEAIGRVIVVVDDGKTWLIWKDPITLGDSDE